MKQKIIVAIFCAIGIKALMGMICIVALCGLVSCRRDWREPSARGDFVCWLPPFGSSAQILGLSEQGKTKETIVIPEEILGYRVDNYTYENHLGELEGNLESENLRELYIIPPVSVYEVDFNCSPNLEKVVFCQGISFLVLLKSMKDNQKGVKCYVPGSWREETIVDEFGCIQDYVTIPDCVLVKEGNVKLHIANVSFMYNYVGDSREWYYCVDNLGYGEKIERVPEDPGNRFMGWYKEPECVNKWDFENDTLPEPIFDEDGKELYQETKLYAKWDL